MTKYMVLRIFDYPYEDVQPCEYNGKTVFDNAGEAKNALEQSVLDFFNECGLSLKDLVNMIAHEEIWFGTTASEVSRLCIDSERKVEWRITRIEF